MSLPAQKRSSRGWRLLMLLALMGHLAGDGTAAPPATEQQLRDKMSSVKTQLKASQAEVDAANKRERELADELGLTQNELENFSTKLRETRTALAQAQTQLDLLQQRVRENEALLIQRQYAMERRLRAIEMQGEVSYLSVLLQSSSFSDFLNQSEFLQRLVSSDDRLINEVRGMREGLERDKLTAIHTVAEIKQLKKNFEDRVEGLDKMQSRQASVLAQLQTQRKKLEVYVTDLEHLSASMEDKLQKMIRARQSVPGAAAVSAGKYMYPVQGVLTSDFGYRIHPITGAGRFHSGLDLAVDEGTPIKAADNGTVIYANWYGGYGNCVIIEHGGGFSTLYGHCSKLLVNEGAHVRQGQTVALVGSTGMSTGPHCHFEVRKDGTPVDPRSRL